MSVSQLSRFKVSAHVGMIGVKSHFIRALDEKDAYERFAAAYDGEEFFGLRIMTPEQIEAHQQAVYDAWKAEQKAKSEKAKARKTVGNVTHADFGVEVED